MSPIRILISNVQQDFTEDLRALTECIRTDTLLGRFFEVFIFEVMTAKSQSVVQVYLALLGAKYGYEDTLGISPTEREFDSATSLIKTA